MLTQAIPALISALNGVLPDSAVRSLAQALGNCGQEVQQRGPMTVMPNQSRDGSAGWDPRQFFPDGWIPGPGSGAGGGNPFIDMPSGSSASGFSSGYGGESWYSTQYGSPNYNFNSSINNTINNTYGGPTNYFGGNSYFENITVNEITIINPPGGPGAPGRAGRDGGSGAAGPAGPPGSNGGEGGGGGGGGFPGDPDVPRLNLPIRRKFVVEDVSATPGRYTVVVDATFNSETCSLDLDRVDLPVITKVTPRKYTLRYYGPDNGLG